MNSVASYVLNTLWIVPLFWAVGWVLSRLVRGAGPWAEHKLWVAILILATIVPATPILRNYFEHEAVSNQKSALNAALPASNAEHTRSSIVVPSNAASWMSGIYLTTVLLFFLRLVWMIRRTVVLVRDATPVSLDGEYAEQWKKSTDTFSVKDTVLRCSADVSGPVTAGFRRAALLLPDTFIENHSPAEFLAAVGHECAHIQRKDFRKNVFYEAASLLIAFHPLTWLIKSQLAQTREMICDGMTAYQLLNSRTYAQLLVQLAGKMRFAAVSPAVGMFDTNSLERRIMTLTTRANSKLGHVAGMAAPLILFGCAAAGWALAQTVGSPDSFYASLSKLVGRQDLTCTYYGYDDEKRFRGFEGTCWSEEKHDKLYRCYKNENPLISQSQIGCEWKVQRALGQLPDQN